MNDRLYNPASVARMVGVHANSIRAWAMEYAVLLSPESQGRPRRLTEGDIAVFQHVKALRDVGFDRDAIIHRLQQLPPSDLRRPYVEPTEAPTGEGEVPTHQPIAYNAMAHVLAPWQDVVSLIDEKHDRTVEKLDHLADRMSQLEAQRYGVLMLALGISVGMLLVATGVWIWWLIGI